MSISQASYADLAKRLAEADCAPGDILVVDVREPDEWADTHLACATNIPASAIDSQKGKIPAGEVWLHCASGARAIRVGQYLNQCRDDLDIKIILDSLHAAQVANLEMA